MDRNRRKEAVVGEPALGRTPARSSQGRNRTKSGARSEAPPLCTAKNRRGQQCKRRPAPGRNVCYYHGGAPGSGAPRGNANARKHGFYSPNLPLSDQPLLVEARGIEGLDDEIALLRVLIDREVAAGADINTVAKGIEIVIRAVATRYRLSGKAREDLLASVLNVLQGFSDIIAPAEDAHAQG